jgi:hypothetical protein
VDRSASHQLQPRPERQSLHLTHARAPTPGSRNCEAEARTSTTSSAHCHRCAVLIANKPPSARSCWKSESSLAPDAPGRLVHSEGFTHVAGQHGWFPACLRAAAAAARAGQRGAHGGRLRVPRSTERHATVLHAARRLRPAHGHGTRHAGAELGGPQELHRVNDHPGQRYSTTRRNPARRRLDVRSGTYPRLCLGPHGSSVLRAA